MKKYLVGFFTTAFALFIVYNLFSDFFHIESCPMPEGAMEVLPCETLTHLLAWFMNWMLSIFYFIGCTLFMYLFYKNKNYNVTLIFLIVTTLLYLLNYAMRFYMDNLI